MRIQCCSSTTESNQRTFRKSLEGCLKTKLAPLLCEVSSSWFLVRGFPAGMWYLKSIHYCLLFRSSPFLERCGIIPGNWIFWKEDRASSKGTLCFSESSCCRGLTSWKKHCNASCYIVTLCIEHCTFVPGKIRLAEYAEKKT